MVLGNGKQHSLLKCYFKDLYAINIPIKLKPNQFPSKL